MPSDSAATSSASRASAMVGRYGEPMRTCVRVFDPARRPRLVLRLGRAAGRAAPPGEAGDRRDGRRARRELRGEGVRRAHRDGPAPRATALPARDRRAGALQGLLGGVESRLPRFRGHGAGRRGVVDRRGLPRRARDGAQRRDAARDRAHASPPRAGRGRTADHRRRRSDQVLGEGRERCREAGWPAPRAAGQGAGLPASTRGRAAVGRRARHVAEAAATSASRRSARSRDWTKRCSSRFSAARKDDTCTRSRTTSIRGGSRSGAGGDRSARNARAAVGRGRRPSSMPT